jgi:hypothetical protein
MEDTMIGRIIAALIAAELVFAAVMVAPATSETWLDKWDRERKNVAIPKRPPAAFTFTPLESGKKVWVSPQGNTAYLYVRLVPLMQDQWKEAKRGSVLANCRVQNTRREYLCEAVPY